MFSPISRPTACLAIFDDAGAGFSRRRYFNKMEVRLSLEPAAAEQSCPVALCLQRFREALAWMRPPTLADESGLATIPEVLRNCAQPSASQDRDQDPICALVQRARARRFAEPGKC